MRPKRKSKKEERYHLDRRADAIAAASEGYDDQLISTKQLAEWFGVSTQWCEVRRRLGHGPPFKRLGPRRIRYKRADVMAWLDERTHTCSKEYAGGANP